MGRQERCAGACSEHRLDLVRAVDLDALLTAAQAARDLARRLEPIVRRVADACPSDPRRALLELQPSAREALQGLAREQDADWTSPDTVTGWWCAQCGNVDLPQPCIGVCVWRPAEWVSVALYERQLALADPSLRAARALRRFLARFGAVVPRPDQWQRNWEALQAQARAALAEHDPDAPAPEPPAGDPTAAGEDVIRVHLWPR
jgi:hypothetical protein